MCENFLKAGVNSASGSGGLTVLKLLRSNCDRVQHRSADERIKTGEKLLTAANVIEKSKRVTRH